MAGSNRKTLVLLNKVRVTPVATEALCKAFIQTNANNHIYAAIPTVQMKLFAKTNISLQKNLMDQGQILPAGWHLLSCKYWESLVRVDSAPHRRQPK